MQDRTGPPAPRYFLLRPLVAGLAACVVEGPPVPLCCIFKTCKKHSREARGGRAPVAREAPSGPRATGEARDVEPISISVPYYILELSQTSHNARSIKDSVVRDVRRESCVREHTPHTLHTKLSGQLS